VRSGIRTVLIATAAALAVVAVFVLATLPPATVRLAVSLPPHVLAGGYHVHSNRSDGTGTIEEIARAAARAGLQFVILTDHGDGTRPPLAPAWIDGVLVVDAVELSTAAGHLVALGLSAPAPYPLAGESRDVIEDVHRLGGLAVIAHPDSSAPGLRWRGNNAPVDGFEWLNADSEWRDERPMRLIGTALRSFVRPSEAVVALFSRPERTLQRWDRPGQRPRFGLAALDAHARIPGWDDGDDAAGEEAGTTVLARPSYEQMFRAVAQVVVLDAPPTGDGPADAARLLGAIRAGRTYSVTRGLAWPAELTFVAVAGESVVAMGGQVPAGDPVTYRASVSGVDDVELRLLRNAEPIGHGRGAVAVDQPGDGADRAAYRVEAYLPGREFPWIVSNPIYAGFAATPLPPVAEGPTEAGERLSLMEGVEWRVERDPSSAGRIDREGGDLGLVFQLGPGVPSGQFVALVAPVDESAGYRHVEFVGRASRPMRISVQVRLPGRQGGQRWGRSVYLDPTPRLVRLPLEDLRPIGPATSQRPIVARIQSVLFVIDTLNARPGADGTVTLTDVALGLGDVGGGG